MTQEEEKILLEAVRQGIWAKDRGVKRMLQYIRKPILRNVDGELVLQQYGCEVKWLNWKIKDYKKIWSINKEDLE